MQKFKNKYLFVCSVNRHRSRTAHYYFSSKLGINSNYEFKSCGTLVDYIEECKAKGYQDFEESKPITRELVEWADIILCMENEHADDIEKNYGKDIRKKCYVLNIKDYYHFGSPELEVILEEKVKFGIKR